MATKAFPGPPGAITPVAGPVIPQHASANGISPAVVGVVRRKRGPAGRETTHPLTINFPPRPLVKLEEPSGTTAGSMVQHVTHGPAGASMAPLTTEESRSEGLLHRSSDTVSATTDLPSLQPSPAIHLPEKAN
jgi:hypothetical protein